jgi:hypothetical protein
LVESPPEGYPRHPPPLCEPLPHIFHVLDGKCEPQVRDLLARITRGREFQEEFQERAQEEENTRYVGVLHVSSGLEWACHMSECQEPYHALRECGVSSHSPRGRGREE